MKSTLIVGYGNPDREDDGAAFYILNALAGRYGCAEIPASDEGLEPNDCSPSFIFSFQLMPEMTEGFSKYERVCFVDAHTENIPDPIQFIDVSSEFQRSPLTHHMTPQTALSITETLYGVVPKAVLCSVRGYQFGFKSELSERTRVLCDQAIEKILAWVNEEQE